ASSSLKARGRGTSRTAKSGPRAAAERCATRGRRSFLSFGLVERQDPIGVGRLLRVVIEEGKFSAPRACRARGALEREGIATDKLASRKYQAFHVKHANAPAAARRWRAVESRRKGDFWPREAIPHQRNLTKTARFVCINTPYFVTSLCHETRLFLAPSAAQARKKLVSDLATASAQRRVV